MASCSSSSAAAPDLKCQPSLVRCCLWCTGSVEHGCGAPHCRGVSIACGHYSLQELATILETPAPVIGLVSEKEPENKSGLRIQNVSEEKCVVQLASGMAYRAIFGAVPLLCFNDSSPSFNNSSPSSNDSSPSSQMQVDPAGIELLKAIPAPIHVVAFTGTGRCGKSTTCSALARRPGEPFAQSRFQPGHTEKPVTEGAQIAAMPHPSGNGSVLIIDAEGSDNPLTVQMSHYRMLSTFIFTVASQVVYCENCAKESTLGDIATTLIAREKIRQAGQEQLLKPDLCLLVIAPKFELGEGYLDSLLAEHPGQDSRNAVRKSIRTVFSSHRLQSLPGSSHPNYMTAIEKLRSDLLDHVTPFENGGITLSGSQVADIVERLCLHINTHGVVDLDDIYARVIHAHLEGVAAEVMKAHELTLPKLQQHDPHLENLLSGNLDVAIRDFEQKTVGISSCTRRDIQEALQVKLQGMNEGIITHNSQLLRAQVEADVRNFADQQKQIFLASTPAYHSYVDESCLVSQLETLRQKVLAELQEMTAPIHRRGDWEAELCRKQYDETEADIREHIHCMTTENKEHQNKDEELCRGISASILENIGCAWQSPKQEVADMRHEAFAAFESETQNVACRAAVVDARRNLEKLLQERLVTLQGEASRRQAEMERDVNSIVDEQKAVFRKSLPEVTEWDCIANAQGTRDPCLQEFDAKVAGLRDAGPAEGTMYTVAKARLNSALDGMLQDFKAKVQRRESEDASRAAQAANEVLQTAKGFLLPLCKAMSSAELPALDRRSEWLSDFDEATGGIACQAVLAKERRRLEQALTEAVTNAWMDSEARQVAENDISKAAEKAMDEFKKSIPDLGNYEPELSAALGHAKEQALETFRVETSGAAARSDWGKQLCEMHGRAVGRRLRSLECEKKNRNRMLRTAEEQAALELASRLSDLAFSQSPHALPLQHALASEELAAISNATEQALTSFDKQVQDVCCKEVAAERRAQFQHELAERVRRLTQESEACANRAHEQLRAAAQKCKEWACRERDTLPEKHNQKLNKRQTSLLDECLQRFDNAAAHVVSESLKSKSAAPEVQLFDRQRSELGEELSKSFLVVGKEQKHTRKLKSQTMWGIILLCITFIAAILVLNRLLDIDKEAMLMW